MKNLVIVESPKKAKTIEKYLGKDYKVMSSYGHIRDLCKKDFSIGTDKQFEPEYEVPDDKKELVKELKSAARKADTVWLASDEDREGEAIAWHLFEVLGLKPENTRRIVFHEITKPAILHAIANPRDIDIDRVNAQQARRVLDRIVGFELSPVLWKKIKPALSAGRVQSVALRLICEREKEIEAFQSQPFFRVNAIFRKNGNAMPFRAELSRRLANETEAREFLDFCAGAAAGSKPAFRVGDVTVKPLKRSPLPPFTTSTLQQEAHRKLGFSVSTTMVVAQKLYEDGRITYMRTDSLNLSDLAIADIAGIVKAAHGEAYSCPRHYHTHSKGAQEAHEAIRPTYVKDRTVPGTLQEQKLYDLIWRRAVASQMADAKIEKTTVEIPLEGRPETFQAVGEVVKFDGFLSEYQPEAGTEEQASLPALAKGDLLDADKITATQRFTLAPPRYNEATLVKKMEDLGIGRPSTYAPTISTIQTRDYVERGQKEGAPRNYEVLTLADGRITSETLTESAGSQKGKLVPTDVGMIVNDFLTRYFPDILDYNFTARIEERLDEIAEGKLVWNDEIADFYSGFHPEIEKINSMRMEHKVGERMLGTDPASGKPVYVKIGRFGPVVQIGNATDEEKPRFASLRKDQSVGSLSLEEALKLFDLPRHVGEFEGKEIIAAVGRFGPYLRWGSLFVSIPKDYTPESIGYDDAVMLIRNKEASEASKVIKEFAEHPEVRVLNGRFGPYIAYKPEGARKAENFKIPKTDDPTLLTFEDIQKLMAEQPAKKTAARKATAKKPATAKKTTSAKKPADKKTAAKKPAAGK